MTPWLDRLWRTVRWPGASGMHIAVRASVDDVRDALLQTLDDCDDLNAQRLRRQIRRTHDAQELLQLRSEAFHLIALTHCQRVADERITRVPHPAGTAPALRRSGRAGQADDRLKA